MNDLLTSLAFIIIGTVSIIGIYSDEIVKIIREIKRK